MKGDPSKHKNAPLCSSALVDGSVSATTQQQPTAIMNYQPHQQQSSQEWCDHVLIKWHDSWLNHVLISQLPWLHELQLHFKWTWHFAQSYYPLNIWVSVTTSGQMEEKCDFRPTFLHRGHPLFVRVWNQNIGHWQSCCCCIMFYITRAFCVQSKMFGDT